MRRIRGSVRRHMMATVFLAALFGSSVVFARDRLTLRVNDAIAEPGGLGAIVIRTYASKPISQGQVCFRARSVRAAGNVAAPEAAVAAAPSVFSSLEGVKVFAKRKDGSSAASLEASDEGQLVLIEFSSDSGSINRIDGPLAVVYFRVRSDVSPGAEFRIEIDAANTLVFDRQGNPVRLAPRAGRLRIRHPAEPFEAEAEDDRIEPGEIAEVGMETFEPVAMASGQIGLLYDPAIADGRVRVKLRKKHGRRRFTVDRGTPGLILVTFRSPDGSWNTVPGEILSVKLPTSQRIPPGTRSRIALDPSLTFFVDPAGDLLRYELEAGVIRFRANGSGGDEGDD